MPLKMIFKWKVFSFAIFTFALGTSNSYDVWNDIPCYKDYIPEECQSNNINLLTVDDYDKCGPAYLNRTARNFFLGASGRRITYKDNKDAFNRIKIVPEILQDISRNSINSSVLRRGVDFPIGVAPVSLQKLAHPDGEIATVKGLSSFKTIMILSEYASTRIEDVAKAAKGHPLQLWMQVTMHRDREVTLDLVRRAEKSGFKALVVTVDSQVYATTTCDSRKRVLQENVTIANINASAIGNGDATDLSTDFKDFRWLTSKTKLPVVAKGILNGFQAREAIFYGATAILVSNHGGRQLDGAEAAIDALAHVVQILKEWGPNDREVYVDGGIRSGSDVFKALARGAKMVFVGRPVIWGLAIGGSDGVEKMMTTLKNEFNQTMLLSGRSNVTNIKGDALLPA